MKYILSILVFLLLILFFLHLHGYLKDSHDIFLDKWNLFHGNVERPDFAIFKGLLIFLLSLHIPLSTLYDAYDYLDASDTEYFEVKFDTYDDESSKIMLTVKDDPTEFQISSYKSYGDDWHKDLLIKINQAETFYVYGEHLPRARGVSHEYAIYELTDASGHTYFTFEQTNEIDKQLALQALPTELLYPILWLIVCAVYTWKVRNKHKA